MTYQSELADPYLTPRTLPARGPFKYLAYGIILAVVLLTIVAALLMIRWSIRPSRSLPDRQPPLTSEVIIWGTDLDIATTRGPLGQREKSGEQTTIFLDPGLSVPSPSQ